MNVGMKCTVGQSIKLAVGGLLELVQLRRDVKANEGGKETQRKRETPGRIQVALGLFQEISREQRGVRTTR